jgi:RimJ/RimL family protein N-acetyltransferase
MFNLPTDVRPLVNTRRALLLWKSKEAFSEDPAVYPYLLGSKASSSAFWEVGDLGGVYYLTDLQEGLKANMNIALWKQEYRGQANHWRHKKMIRYVMGAYDLQRLGAEVASSNLLSLRLCEAVGFQKEGELRNFGFYQGELTNAFSLSLLREEVL